MTPLERPPRLRPGDRVAVVAPSGPMPPRELERGVAVLREWGLEPVVMPHVLDGPRGCGTWPRPTPTGPPTSNAPGATRPSPGSSPRAAATARSGCSTWWTGTAWPGASRRSSSASATPPHCRRRSRSGSESRPCTVRCRRWRTSSTTASPRSICVGPCSNRNPSRSWPLPGRGRWCRAGPRVTFGGTLSLLASGVGTAEHRPSADGGILLLEEIDEADYRVDRFLTQLRRSAWLDGVAGIVLGSWTESGPYERVRAVLLDRLGDLGAPIVEEFGFGHCTPSLTVPLGVPAELDADAGTLDFMVPALR
ncbi:LD-carboxypeptidase [Glycomyces albus]